MGYKKELFVGEVPSKFVCNLCCGVVATPMFWGDGSVACVTCMAWNSARTPLSLNQMALFQTPDPSYMIQLNNLEMRCANFQLGCTEALQMATFTEHMLTCGLSEAHHVVSMVQNLELSVTRVESPYSDIMSQAEEAEAVLEARIAQPQTMFTSLTGELWNTILQSILDALFESFYLSVINKNIANRLNTVAAAGPGRIWKTYAKIQEDGDHLHVNLGTILAHVRLDKVHVLVWQSDEASREDSKAEGCTGVSSTSTKKYSNTVKPLDRYPYSVWKVGHSNM